MIARCMSTQHPDNVSVPFFSSSDQIGGESEVTEAYYAYSHLGCDEQMWDAEGKEVDNFVVKKLLSRFESYFRENVLGEDVALTMRVPNPTVEEAEAKILLESLEGIPRSYDASALFYQRDVAPIYEVILPMTSSHRCIDRVHQYYKNFIVNRQHLRFADNDITVMEWIGQFRPSQIRVTPLVENLESQLNVHAIVETYLKNKDLTEQRVFLARSDPAMNYGTIGAVIANKIALKRLEGVQERSGVKLYPIIGAGSAPFRGHLSPQNVDRVLAEYPSAYTHTVQSAFKYDWPLDEVRNAIRKIRNHEQGPADEVDEEGTLEIVDRYAAAYQAEVHKLAPMINRIAAHSPRRRKRKKHTGLFGYARDMGGVTLPRAITFTSSLYAMGLPPELLGISALSREDFEYLGTFYRGMKHDLETALGYLDPDAGEMEARVATDAERLGLERRPVEEHIAYTRKIRTSLEAKSEGIGDLIVMAGHVRRFLG